MPFSSKIAHKLISGSFTLGHCCRRNMYITENKQLVLEFNDKLTAVHLILLLVMSGSIVGSF